MTDQTNRSDSYKFGHWQDYPDDMTAMYSYFECRGSRWTKDVAFFGLQGILDEYFDPENFPTHDQVDTRAAKIQLHMGPVYNKKGWHDLVDLGYWPIEVCGLPEGTVAPLSVPLFSVCNTHDDFSWVTNWCETRLCHVWYPTTVCTSSRHMRRIWAQALMKSADNLDGLNFKLHDFGYRGTTGDQQAQRGGAAHLAAGWRGTDTYVCLDWIEKHYGDELAGFSIPAQEHSTVCANTCGTGTSRDQRLAAQKDFLYQLLQRHPSGPLAIVSDTYDVYRTTSFLTRSQDSPGGGLKEMVLARDGFIVIRPDSSSEGHEMNEQLVKLMDIAWKHVGGTIVGPNMHKLIDPHVRFIWGDGIDRISAARMLAYVVSKGYSADNFAQGCGAGLLQQMTRDDLGCAFKGSAIRRGNTWYHDVQKDPVTDTGKKSKPGQVVAIHNPDDTLGWDVIGHPGNAFVQYMHNADRPVRFNFESVRERTEIPECLTVSTA